MATSIVLGYLPPLKDLPQNWGKRTIFTFDALGLDVSWEFNPSRIGRNNPRTLCSICYKMDTNNFRPFYQNIKVFFEIFSTLAELIGENSLQIKLIVISTAGALVVVVV